MRPRPERLHLALSASLLLHLLPWLFPWPRAERPPPARPLQAELQPPKTIPAAASDPELFLQQDPPTERPPVAASKQHQDESRRDGKHAGRLPRETIAPASRKAAPPPAETERPVTETTAASRAAHAPTSPDWQQAVGRQFAQQMAQGDFYPAAAIAEGLQGEVLVLLLLDASGNVTAARVEQSSGHPLLDAAALRAVRALRGLPADAPRQAMQAVRFKLR